MPPGTEQEHEPYRDGGDPFVHPLDSIDSSLLSAMPDDERFSSGVPDRQRANALDFIQMTGLTRAPAHGRPAARGEAPPEDSSPTAPLSFYEKGVADVDDAGGDGGFGGLADALLDAKLMPDQGSDVLRGAAPSPTAEAFKAIVAGLQTESATDDELFESSVESAAEERTPSSDLLALFERIEEAARADIPAATSGDGEQVTAGPEMVVDAEAAADALTDDWDALIDSVYTDPPPAEEIPATDVAAPRLRARGSGALAEAEQLMQALGQRHSPPIPDSPVPSITLAPATPSTLPSLLPLYSSAPQTPVTLDGELGFDYGAAPVRRRSRNTRRGWRWLIMLVALAVIGTGLVAGYFYVVASALIHMEDLNAKALTLQAQERYEEAARSYDELARKYGSGPAGLDAQFLAAYVLTLGEPRSSDDKDRRYRAALARFQSFVEANPAHARRTRALTIMGRLHYELGEYDEAIAILRDEVDPLSDPQAALAMLRYLARSYSQKGDYDAAESAYLQAATLPGNYSVDQDYYSLGEMYKLQAELANSEGEKAAHIAAAAAYWRRAVQVPGIDPGQRALLTERLDGLVYQDSAEAVMGTMEVYEAPPTETAPALE